MPTLSEKIWMDFVSRNSTCPCPAGDHSTRQWLARVTRLLPPSCDRRMNEFSPVMTTSCGSTICCTGGVAMVPPLLCRHRRPFGLPGVLRRLRIDVGPGTRALGPDMRGDLHAVGVVERAGAQCQHLGRVLAVAPERRAAVAAEVARQRAAARRIALEDLGRAVLELELVARHDAHHRAVRAGSLLAVAAVAGAKLGGGSADAVADRAAETAAVEIAHSLSFPGQRSTRSTNKGSMLLSPLRISFAKGPGSSL